MASTFVLIAFPHISYRDVKEPGMKQKEAKTNPKEIFLIKIGEKMPNFPIIFFDNIANTHLMAVSIVKCKRVIGLIDQIV